MDIEGIRLLMRVVELGSIQRAAHQFGIPRSSLRRKLENLEAEFGTALFARTTVGVALTAAGAVVVEEGRVLLEHYERIVTSAKSTSGDTSGIVRVIIPTGMPDATRIILLRGIGSIAPALSVDESEYAEPLDHVHEPFDLMFHFGEPPTRGQWFSRVLFRMRLVPLASAAYLERHGTPTSPADLARHRILGWKAARWNPREWPLWAGGVVRVEPFICSQNSQLVHRAAQEGLGILLGSSEHFHLPLTTPLVPVLADEVGRELTIRCLSPLPSETEPRTRAVLSGIHAMLTSIGPGR